MNTTETTNNDNVVWFEYSDQRIVVNYQKWVEKQKITFSRSVSRNWTIVWWSENYPINIDSIPWLWKLLDDAVELIQNDLSKLS